eukprot:14043597-Alexandrium_andersonii.AAC.1
MPTGHVHLLRVAPGQRLPALGTPFGRHSSAIFRMAQQAEQLPPSPSVVRGRRRHGGGVARPGA